MSPLIIFAIVVTAACIFIFLQMRRWLPRLRRELYQLREGARASTDLNAHMELIYQTQMQRQIGFDVPLGDSPFQSGSWSLLGGDGIGWPANTFYKVRGLAIHRGELHASLTGPSASGPSGYVWRLGKGIDAQVGGDAGDSWHGEDSFVDHLFSMDRDTLLVAEKSGVWRLTDNHWTQMNSGLDLDSACGPYCFAKWNEQVVMGQWGKARIAQLSADGSWTYLPEPRDGWGEGTRTIYCLMEFKGHLYAGTGTGKLTGSASAVWRFDGINWEQVGGTGIRGSWARKGIPFILSLTQFNDLLLATISRPDNTPQACTNVWVFDGNRWCPLGVGSTPALMADSLIMNDAIVYKGRLIVATGHSTRRPAQLWMLDASQCWHPVGPPELDIPLSGEGGWWVYRLCTDGERLYIGTAGHKGAAKVLCFTSDANAS